MEMTTRSGKIFKTFWFREGAATLFCSEDLKGFKSIFYSLTREVNIRSVSMLQNLFSSSPMMRHDKLERLSLALFRDSLIFSVGSGLTRKMLD